MNNFNTLCAVIVMVVAAIAGIFFGGIFNESLGGAILFSLIAGIACIIHAIDNREE